MSPTASPTELKQCPQRQLLVNDIQAAIDDILALHNGELEAVLKGDFTTGAETASRLKQVRERKRLLIERLREHVGSHGC